MKRRDFLKHSMAAAAVPYISSHETFAQNKIGQPLVIASDNGLESVRLAYRLIESGSDAIDAVIAGANLVEDDPNDHTVGLGGLPNEDGIVQLDACCMHGPTHNAGAVAALENIRNPSRVAQLVMERTDHVLLVGKGALQFALRHGFKEENLLTDEARKLWLKWRENLSDEDDWFPEQNQEDKSKTFLNHQRHYGTITCCGLDLNGGISGVTTTSGLSYKIAGRVGDSPIIGAGLYVDNEVGACGSTGRGEENIKNSSCAMIVEFMRMGKSPQEACLSMCRRIVDHARARNLKTEDGKPLFNVSFYAITKDGRFGAASIKGPESFWICDASGARKEKTAFLYEE